MKQTEAQKRGSARYYAKNSKKYVEWARLRRARQRADDLDAYLEHRRENERKYDRKPVGIWRILKQNSKVRNRVFELDLDDFISWYESQEKVCAYCAKPPKESKRLEIDRKDNGLGYLIENMALACEDCNDVKGKVLTFDEMKIVGEVVMKKRL